VDTDLPPLDKFAALPRRRRSGVSAFLSVQEGCDKFCTYCVVPYTRGAEVSRPLGDLLDEAAQLLDSGTREITLLGQNVNAWEDGSETLATLIRRLAGLPGLVRIRYTTSHPINMTDDLIAAHAEVPQLMPYLHLPVQAGSDRILKAMNRHHTAADYLGVIARVRAANPDIALSGDFIVGFPGETEEDFEATLNLVRDVRYAAAYSFKYSARPGTPAATMEGQVPEPVKDERLQRLQALLAEQSRAFNASKVGETTRILIDRVGRKPGQMIGKSPWLQSVFVDTDAKIGDMIDVRLTEALPNSLGGVLCTPAQAGA
jgi:tRNA-2-methylthio-N6-dimethylallyladenosine synthase